ncbi:MAG TPA: cell division protein FtsQ/DivIB [Candidatus Omnitrophota bacterium]|nr:cell division protein FtsQ/DivIB [Candidatus Omnitrophota bacterium]
MAKRKNSPISLAAVKISIVIILALTVGIFLCQRTFHLLTHSRYFSVQMVALDPSLSFIDKKDFANLSGKNIFTLNLKQIQRHLVLKYPQVSDLRVVRQFPNQIHIQAKPRFPAAQVQSSSNILTLDERGVVVASSTKKDGKLPYISTPHDHHPRYTLGLPLPSGDHEIGLNIINSFKVNRALSSYAIEQIDIENLSKINVYLSNKLHVILDASKVGQKVKILGVILAKGQVDLKEVKYIDLRFKEPIVGKK